MPRVLLGWEFGAGRGHVLKLKRFAEALSAPHLVDAGLCSMGVSGELSGLCDYIVQTPSLTYDVSVRAAHGHPPTSTWGEFLGDIGLRDPQFMASQIGWWQDLMLERRIGLLVADYAPFAVLAARGLGIAVVGTGLGYSLTPAVLPEFPVLIERFSTRIHDENALTALINEAAVPLGVPPLRRLPEINLMDDMLVQSLPFFDPHEALRDKPYLPPLAEAPTEIGTSRDDIFIYASARELEAPGLVEAITSLPMPVRIYALRLTPETRAALACGSNVTLQDKAFAVDDIAMRARLIIHAGQPGTMTMGLACAMAQIALPQHLEQQFHAEKLAELGTLKIISPREMKAAEMRELVLESYHSIAIKTRARELAHFYMPAIRQSSRPAIRERLDQVMTSR